jgi:Flp pilus assembly pilin Flp
MADQAAKGQGMVEYALIIALVAVVAAVGFVLFSEALTAEHNSLFASVRGLFGQ